MKKFYFFIILLLILLVSVSSVNGMSCKQFSMSIPDGFAETEGWGSDGEHTDEIYVATGIPRPGEVHRWLEIHEVGTTDEFKDFDYSNLTESGIVLENYSNGNLFVAKCRVPGYDGGINRENFTYAHFDKGGYHYEMFITYSGNINNLKLSDDVSLIKELIDSIKHRK